MLLTVGLLCGCTTRQPDVASTLPEPTLGPVPPITSLAQITRPIDSYLPDVQRILGLLSIETRKVNSCLASKRATGQYSPSDDQSLLAPYVAGARNDNVVRSDLWGFFDTDRAKVATYGYHRSAAEPGMLMGGVPTGADATVLQACREAAEGGLPSDGGVLALAGTRSLPNRGPQVPTNDSRWVAAVADWAKCMAEHGFPDYPTPLDAIGNHEWYQASGVVTPKEIATASADIECKLKINLVGIGLAVQRAYDQQYIEANRDALAKYKQQLDTYAAQQ